MTTEPTSLAASRGVASRFSENARSLDLYRSVWRWHFYAGLLVLPFLFVLAITGALYLFRDELDALIHSDLKHIEAAGQVFAPSVLVAAAQEAQPGVAMKIVTPATSDLSTEVVVKEPGGEKRSVYVDQHTGRVLGALPQGGTIMGTVRQLHSLAFFGPVANGIMEIAAGWTILLVLTGIYLWWPRDRSGGVVTVRGRPRQRTWWRDLHAVTGLFAGMFVLFLALSGMPWSIVWGDKFGAFVDARGLGVPAGVWGDYPKSTERLADTGPVAWTFERTPNPASTEGETDIGVDTAFKRFADMGFPAGFALALPTTPIGVYSASIFPDDVSRQRVAHLDRYSGRVLQDTRYADYGAVAKVTEWGISVHMGQEFGPANQLLMLAACLAIVLLCVSATVMWWKRRPPGGIGVPPLPMRRSRFLGVTAILAVGGLIFPLTGASLLLVLLVDWAVSSIGQRAA